MDDGTSESDEVQARVFVEAGSSDPSVDPKLALEVYAGDALDDIDLLSYVSYSGLGTLSLVSVSSTSNGTLIYDSISGFYDYTAHGTFVGADIFTFEVTDGTTSFFAEASIFCQARTIPGASIVPGPTVTGVRNALNRNFNFTNNVVGALTPFQQDIVQWVVANRNATSRLYYLNRGQVDAQLAGLNTATLNANEAAVPAAILAANPTAVGIAFTTYAEVSLTITAVGNLRQVSVNVRLYIAYNYTVGATTFQGEATVIQNGNPFQMTVDINQASSTPLR